MKKSLLVGVILSSLIFSVNAQNAGVTWKSKTEIICAGTNFYFCLGDEDLKSLSGKTIKYKHPRGGDFGTVSIFLKTDKTIEAKNGKGGTGGTWEIKDSKLIFKTKNWNDFDFSYVRVGDYLFMMSNRETGAHYLVPVEVSE
jgi:hypothetical protein